ncbi:MAG: hypothetical protein IKN72_11425 [Clostridia bacterium]|nr:hypothetical protein [Clostridia bacterium]
MHKTSAFDFAYYIKFHDKLQLLSPVFSFWAVRKCSRTNGMVAQKAGCTFTVQTKMRAAGRRIFGNKIGNFILKKMLTEQGPLRYNIGTQGFCAPNVKVTTARVIT